MELNSRFIDGLIDSKGWNANSGGTVKLGVTISVTSDYCVGDFRLLVEQRRPQPGFGQSPVEHLPEFATAQEVHAEIHGEIAHFQKVGNSAEDLLQAPELVGFCLIVTS